MLYCAKIVLCEDPLSPIYDPIELLRRLVPSYQREGEENPLIDAKEESLPPIDYWPDFLKCLERELDTSLEDLRDCPEREFRSSADLGVIISRIQRQAESSSDTDAVVIVRRFMESDAEALAVLRDDYLTERIRPLGPDELMPIIKNDGSRMTYRFLAYFLGQAVGFIETTFGHGTPFGDPPDSPVRSLQIKHLHVATHMHNAGVGRRLVRRLIELANETECRWVWVDQRNVESRRGRESSDRDRYERAGFTCFPEPETAYITGSEGYEQLRFELFREKGPKAVYAKEFRGYNAGALLL